MMVFFFLTIIYLLAIIFNMAAVRTVELPHAARQENSSSTGKPFPSYIFHCMPSCFQTGCTSFKQGVSLSYSCSWDFICPPPSCTPPPSAFPMCAQVFGSLLVFLGWCEYHFFDLFAVSIYCTVYWSPETPVCVCAFQKSSRRAPLPLGSLGSLEFIWPDFSFFCLCFSYCVFCP